MIFYRHQAPDDADQRLFRLQAEFGAQLSAALRCSERFEIHSQRDNIDLLRRGDMHSYQIGFQRRAEGHDPVSVPGQHFFDRAEEGLRRRGKISAQDMPVEGVDHHRHPAQKAAARPKAPALAVWVCTIYGFHWRNIYEQKEGEEVRRSQVR